MSEAIQKFVSVPFMGTEIKATSDEMHYVALKPLVEGIGLDWTAVYRKIKNNSILQQGIVVMTIPSDGGNQETVCLPLKKLNGLLFLINPEDYNHKPELKERLVKYQMMCYDALYEYFNKGVAINPYANLSKAQWMRLAADQEEKIEAQQHQLLEAGNKIWEQQETIEEQQETIKERDDHIVWIDGQRQDMSDAVENFAPVGKPAEGMFPRRGSWVFPKGTRAAQQIAPGRFNSRRNDAWDRMIRKAIKDGVIQEEDLDDLKVVVKADNLKGTKHTACETLLLEMLDSGKIMVAPKPLIE